MRANLPDGRFRHDDPNFSGFEERGGDIFFYANGVEHTYWQISTLTEKERQQLDETQKIFAEAGLAATLKHLNTPW